LLFLSFHFTIGLLNHKNLFFFAGANVIPFSLLATFYESFFRYFLFLFLTILFTTIYR